MAGESNQRISWWKFKSKGSQDPNNDDPDHQHMPLSLSPHDNNPPATSSAIGPTTSTTPHPPAESSTQHFKDLREQFIQSKNTDLNNNSIFGVELEKSLQVASAKIYVPNSSQVNHDEEDKSADVAEYGEIPVVVAKCGSFLKLNGLSVEGIFRVGGSSKRVKELQQIFSEAPDYGKKLDWDGFTVHDAASLLRRYLNSLPQPVIPLDQYEAFRAPLKSRPRVLAYFTYRGVPNPPKDLTATTSPAIVPIASTPNPGQTGAPQSTPAQNSLTTPTPSQFVAQESRKPVPILSDDPSSLKITTAPQDEPADSTQEPEQAEVDEKTKELAKKRRRRLKKHKRFVEDIKGALEEYQKLVAGLPVLRKKLLLYILDLLDAFSEHSEENRMSSSNLSAVFQPSILSHPKHDMSPDEYVLSQKVVEFLVEYSYKLLPEQTGVQIHHQ